MTYSVIIPCYNSQDTIGRALESIVNQTYINYEIIIVDDGSTDNTKKIIEEFFNDKKIHYKYIYQKNIGPSMARNKGVENSSGEYIAFLDSDDEWHPKKLEIQWNVICDKQLNFLGSTYTYHDFEEENIDEVKLETYSFSSLLIKTKFSTPGVIIARTLFNDLGGFDTTMKYAEDNDLWLRASIKDNLYMIVQPKLVRLYKSAFGSSGLSAHMYNMYLGELYLIKKLFINNNIFLFQYLFLNIFITLKFLRRLIMNKIDRKN